MTAHIPAKTHEQVIADLHDEMHRMNERIAYLESERDRYRNNLIDARFGDNDRLVVGEKALRACRALVSEYKSTEDRWGCTHCDSMEHESDNPSCPLYLAQQAIEAEEAL